MSSHLRNPIRLDSHEMQLRLQKLERRFENMERHGEVSDVKYDKEQKRWFVKFNDGQDKDPAPDNGEGKENSDTFKSDWRPWQSFSHGTISISAPPKKGQKVTFRSPGGYPEQGYAMPYHYGPETPSPHDKEDEVVIQIRKPKQQNDQNGSGGSGSGSGGGSGGTGGSSGSSGSGSGDDQNDDALRIRTSKSGYTLTVGKLGASQDASASDGDGQSQGDKNTFQMSISRDMKTITCGKFKATMGKDGAVLSYDNKTSLTLSDGKIEHDVDGTKHTVTKDGNKFEGGTVHHNTRNIGDSHVHTGVTPGGGKTGDPDE